MEHLTQDQTKSQTARSPVTRSNGGHSSTMNVHYKFVTMVGPGAA